LGRYDDAIAVYNEILEVYPDEIRVLSGKGDALLKLGKYEGAIAIYDKVQLLPVDDIGAIVHAGESKAL
jgi:tetratricopeptide (TPR) repeat protein